MDRHFWDDSERRSGCHRTLDPSSPWELEDPNGVPSCSPGVDAQRPLLGKGVRWQIPMADPTGVPSEVWRRGCGPQGESLRRNPNGVHDRAGIGVDAGVPGERSLSLGTPGLHEASPLGLKARRGTDAWRISVEQAKQSGHLAPQDERKACAGMQSFELRECQARRSGMAAWLRLIADGGLAPKCRRIGDCERLSVQDVQPISAERDGHYAYASLAASR